MGRYEDEIDHDDVDDERDDPQSIDIDEDDEELATAECPHCGTEVLHVAMYCKHCDHWMTPRLLDNRGWLVMTALVVLAVIAYFWIFKRG
jgi:hypothetical protein